MATKQARRLPPKEDVGLALQIRGKRGHHLFIWMLTDKPGTHEGFAGLLPALKRGKCRAHAFGAGDRQPL